MEKGKPILITMKLLLEQRLSLIVGSHGVFVGDNESGESSSTFRARSFAYVDM